MDITLQGSISSEHLELDPCNKILDEMFGSDPDYGSFDSDEEESLFLRPDNDDESRVLMEQDKNLATGFEGAAAYPKSTDSGRMTTHHGNPCLGGHGSALVNERIMTLKTLPNFVNPEGPDMPVAGHPDALTALSIAVECCHANVQRVSKSDAYEAYEPLHIALRQMCSQIDIDCPSTQQLCKFHRSSQYADILSTVMSTEEYWLLPGRRDYLDTSMMIAILRLLAANDSIPLGRYIVYQLGIITSEHGITYARTYPAERDHVMGTAWLYYDNKNQRLIPNWHGICSDQALYGFTQTSPFPTNISIPAMGSTSSSPYSPARGTSTPYLTTQASFRVRTTKRKLDSQDAPDTPSIDYRRKKRKTAQPVEVSRVDYPPHYNPNQILDAPGEAYYNNLLRIALWFGNKEIHDRLNSNRLSQGLSPQKALSSITKRISVACERLASQHGIPVFLLRYVIGIIRVQNGVNTREKGNRDMDAMVAAYQRNIDAALEMIVSASPNDGLLAHRTTIAPGLKTNGLDQDMLATPPPITTSIDRQTRCLESSNPDAPTEPRVFAAPPKPTTAIHHQSDPIAATEPVTSAEHDNEFMPAQGHDDFAHTPHLHEHPLIPLHEKFDYFDNYTDPPSSTTIMRHDPVLPMMAESETSYILDSCTEPAYDPSSLNDIPFREAFDFGDNLEIDGIEDFGAQDLYYDPNWPFEDL